jgi:hypothetical protein
LPASSNEGRGSYLSGFALKPYHQQVLAFPTRWSDSTISFDSVKSGFDGNRTTRARLFGHSGSTLPTSEDAMVTPDEMRIFAAECLRWSDQAGNASHRDLMVRIAKQWMTTAAMIERRVAAGDQLAAPDLRNKLD